MPQTIQPPGPTPAGPSSVRQFTPAQLSALLGRTQWPELHFQQSHSGVVQSVIIPKNFTLTRPLYSIHIMWRGRIAVTVANYTATNAESLANIINRIRLFGTHRLFNSLRPIDVTGSWAFAWARLFQQRGNSMYINGVRQAEMNVPLTSAWAATTAGSPYDIELHYEIPLVPMLGPHSRLAVLPFMANPDDWGDTLQLQLDLGDKNSIGDSTGATVAFTAFGSGGGSPTVTIYGNYGILGPAAKALQDRMATLVRASGNVISSSVSAVGNRIRLTQLQRTRTTNVYWKTGVRQVSALTTGSPFATLIDTIVDQPQILVDNKPVRNTFDAQSVKEYGGFMFNTVNPGGYSGLSFIDGQNPLTYFRGDKTGGAAFELVANILTAVANQDAEFCQEQVYRIDDPSQPEL